MLLWEKVMRWCECDVGMAAVVAKRIIMDHPNYHLKSYGYSDDVLQKIAVSYMPPKKGLTL